jgi:hypothetical protein
MLFLGYNPRKKITIYERKLVFPCLTGSDIGIETEEPLLPDNHNKCKLEIKGN